MKHSAGGKPLASRRGSGIVASRVALLGIIVAISAACSSLPLRDAQSNVESTSEEAAGLSPSSATGAIDRGSIDDQIIASLVDALAQLREPLNTTVQVSIADDSGLGKQVTEGLARRGFGIQRVDADLGANLLNWQRLPESGTPRNTPIEWSVTIGTLGVKRRFEVSDGNELSPAGPMILSGTRKLIRLDDTAFASTVGQPSPNSTIEFSSSDSMLENLPTISLITDDVIQGISQRAVNGADARALNSSKVEVSNLFNSDAVDGYGGISAFTNIRDDYVRVRGETVIFADDSLRLGPQGKQQVEAFLQEYQPNVDLIGLIGCSNGPTKLEIGNQGLALGRSQRVAEELLALGVPRESILDEGCWSETSAGGRFPSRGVVLELLRRPLG